MNRCGVKELFHPFWGRILDPIFQPGNATHFTPIPESQNPKPLAGIFHVSYLDLRVFFYIYLHML